MNRPLIASALLAGLVYAGGVPAAYAAPQPFESFRANCDGFGDTRITEPGNGPFTPFFIEDTNSVIVPYVVHFTVTGGGETIAGTFIKPSPESMDAISCTFEFRFHIADDLYVLTGDVTGVVRGAP